MTTQPYFLFELSFSKAANDEFDPQPYSMSACFSMIISAKTEELARDIALKDQWPESGYMCASTDTANFWGPTIENQIKYIKCVMIGVSLILESKVICRCTQYDTG